VLTRQDVLYPRFKHKVVFFQFLLSTLQESLVTPWAKSKSARRPEGTFVTATFFAAPIAY
jgi:hypothetical protein